MRAWQGCSLFGLEHYGDQQQEDRRHGYAAGTLQFDDGRTLLRHWPRLATFDEVNGWRFTRDEESCILQDDGGTKPEVVWSRSDDTGPAANRDAYLSEQEATYALAIFAVLKGISNSTVTRHLCSVWATWRQSSRRWRSAASSLR